MWRETTKHERNRRIFEEEFEAFLPARILDFHCHVFCDGVLQAGTTYNCAGHCISAYGLDSLRGDLAELYPGRETAAVCFGNPNVKNDFVLNNAYVAEGCDRERFFGLRLFDPREADHDAVRAELEAGRFLGIKPYLSFVRKADPNEVEIVEMLPHWIMEIINDLGQIVMLHIPRKQRLADPLNQEQLVTLCNRYPKAKIALAHIGRAYFLRNIVGNLERLKDLPNLWYDLAMLNNWEVLEYLFQNVPAERIVYATDMPIAVAPGKSVEINDQYTYVTTKPWPLSITDDHGKLVFTSFAYEEVRAIRKAVERTGRDRAFVEGLFWGNGMALLESVG